MQRIALPYVTTSEGISVFDTDNQYRPRLWDRASSDIDWLHEEDNGLLLSLVEKFSPMTTRSLDNPIIWWTEDERTNIHTNLTATSAANDTTLNVADPRLAVVGTFLFFPADGEVVKVTAVDYSTSVLTVTRGYNNTTATAKAVDDKVISLGQYMSELAEPALSNGRVPGTAVWNTVSIVNNTIRVSKMQENSKVEGGWGQLDKSAVDAMLDLRRQVGKAMLFNSRGTTDTGAAGQEYISQGLYHYIHSGILDLGDQNSNLTWPILNDWLEARFDPDASGDTKVLLAGPWLFRAIQRMVRDTQGTAPMSYFEPAVGTRVYQIQTDGGYSVDVMQDKYGLSVKEGLGDWGFLLDMKNISGAHYKGFEFQWLENIQPRRAVMYREDAFIGSFSLIAKHEGCHGMIRGAGKPIVNR